MKREQLEQIVAQQTSDNAARAEENERSKKGSSEERAAKRVRAREILNKRKTLKK